VQGPLLGLDDDGTDGVARGPRHDDGIGLEVGRGTVVDVRELDAHRQATGHVRAVEAGRDLHRELGVLGEDRRY
jgi:hypothetical protein